MNKGIGSLIAATIGLLLVTLMFVGIVWAIVAWYPHPILIACALVLVVLVISLAENLKQEWNIYR